VTTSGSWSGQRRSDSSRVAPSRQFSVGETSICVYAGSQWSLAWSRYRTVGERGP